MDHEQPDLDPGAGDALAGDRLAVDDGPYGLIVRPAPDGRNASALTVPAMAAGSDDLDRPVGLNHRQPGIHPTVQDSTR
ncbi:hypothetical protein [Prauserella endophytica]|uniref:Uncharacterized protein n=1 Tax=Prauserella endophytica TaxID=1592324 RepID=A0ABY2SB10_9PSEU|nr:hypothetical protein [Prauserella endophytica]TKG72701.1 hypothetical protein FCN18_05560 [Prauserella endophytica]